MGKGDKKTKRGKIFKSSYGRLRPKKKSMLTHGKAKYTSKKRGTSDK
jgi:ribosomal small subunit protein bTHX